MLRGPQPLPGFEESYTIARNGTVKSLSTGRNVTPRMVKGVYTVSLRSRKYTLTLNRALLAAYRPRIHVDVVDGKVCVISGSSFEMSRAVVAITVNASTHLDSLVWVTMSELRRIRRDGQYRVLPPGILQAHCEGNWYTLKTAVPASDCPSPWGRLSKLADLHRKLPGAS